MHINFTAPPAGVKSLRSWTILKGKRDAGNTEVRRRSSDIPSTMLWTNLEAAFLWETLPTCPTDNMRNPQQVALVPAPSGEIHALTSRDPPFNQSTCSCSFKTTTLSVQREQEATATRRVLTKKQKTYRRFKLQRALGCVSNGPNWRTKNRGTEWGTELNSRRSDFNPTNQQRSIEGRASDGQTDRQTDTNWLYKRAAEHSENMRHRWSNTTRSKQQVKLISEQDAQPKTLTTGTHISK